MAPWQQPWQQTGLFAHYGHCFVCLDAGIPEWLTWFKIQCRVTVVDGCIVADRFKCRNCGSALAIGREVLPFETGVINRV